MDRMWVFVVALISGVTSGVASSCLFCWLYGIRHTNKRKLMWRQLKQLAAADIVYSCFVSATMVVNMFSTRSLPVWRLRTATMARACAAMGAGYSTGFYASMFVEAHLALCTAAAICRWTWLLHILRKSLAAAWPFGLLLSLLDVVVVGVDWKFEHGCISEGPDTISIACVMLCAFVVLSSYIGSLAQACTATRVVRHRIWHRTQHYLLVMLICLSPNLVRIASTKNWIKGNPIYFLVALSLFNLKGLANTLVYAVQSHYIRRMLLRQGRSEQDTKRGESGSFHVGVGRVDIVDVAPIAAAALEQSERETAVLEGTAAASSISPPLSPSVSVADLQRPGEQGGAPSSPARQQQWRPPPGSPAPSWRLPPGSPTSSFGRPLPGAPAPQQHWGPPPGFPGPQRSAARPASGDSFASDEDLLGCFEASSSPSDVRQGLVWTLSLADGLNRREARSPRGQRV